MSDVKPYRHRFPMTIIQHAVWLYHRFPLSYRDVQELLHQRGIQVSHETLREWCIKFGDPSSLTTCASGNPVGVPAGISTRCVRASMASDTGYGGLSTSTSSCLTSSFSGIGTPKRQRRSCPGCWGIRCPRSHPYRPAAQLRGRDPRDTQPDQHRPSAGDLHGALQQHH